MQSSVEQRWASWGLHLPGTQAKILSGTIELSLRNVRGQRGLSQASTFNSKCFFPLHIDLPPPATRERPPGCKTVFVGGLPENGTEQIIVEVFEQCGEIIAIRKSKKNFCHIRFAEEYMVDKALYLSGRCFHMGTLPVRQQRRDWESEYWQLQQPNCELNIIPSCLQRWQMPVTIHHPLLKIFGSSQLSMR